MSLKAKISSLIISFILLAGILVVGVFAARKANFQVGGSIEFQMEGINATIQLSESYDMVYGLTPTNGEEVGVDIMKPVEINDDMTASEIKRAFSSWYGLSFVFDQTEDNDYANIWVEITNNSETNYIDVALSHDAGNLKNVTMAAYNDDWGAIRRCIAPGETVIFWIYFYIEDTNYKPVVDDFVVEFEMNNLMISEVPDTYDDYDGQLYFELDYEYEYTAAVSAFNTETEEYTSYLGNLEIPPYVTDGEKIYAVTHILCNGFGNDEESDYCSGLTSVVIPNTVYYIGGSAFSGCQDLTSVQFPSNDLGLEGSAFYGTGLTNVVIPSTLDFWEDTDFANCTSLESVIFEEGCIKVSNYMFEGCVNLRSVTLSESLTYIYDDAFAGCESLALNKPSPSDAGNYLGTPSNPYFALVSFDDTVEEYEINENCQVIAQNIFAECTNLKSIVLPSGLKNIDYAFWDCTSLESVRIKYGLTSIGYYAFYGCTSLVDINIPSSVTTIEHSAFSGCTSLESIKIPNSVTGSVYFSDCTGLTNVIIGKGVTSVNFFGCTGLTEFNIPDHVTSVNFAGCTGLTEFNIPDHVTSVNFDGCTSLETVVLGDGVNWSENSDVFRNCTSLKTLIMGNGVKKMPDMRSLKALETVVLSDQITSIGEYTNYSFYEFENLKNVTLGKGLKTIETWAFRGCTSLESIVIPEGVTSIGNSAFSHCTSLKSIIIPDSVTYIGDFVFTNCDNLIYNEKDNGKYLGNENNKYIILVDVITPGFENFTIQNGCKFISNAVFANDGVNLINITIPESMLRIGYQGFSYCWNLKTVIINSETIAQQLDGEDWDDCGRILANATTVKVLTSIVTAGKLNSYVTENFTTVTTEGEYTVYTKA